MADRPSEIAYHLPRSIVSVSGVATSRVDLGTGNRSTTATVDVRLGVEADDDDFYILELDSKLFSDIELTLKLTPDGRLSSAKHDATGAGAKILSGLVTTVATAASLVPMLTMKESTARALRKEEQYEYPRKYGDEHPKLSQRREQATETLEKIADRQIAIARGAADLEPAEKSPPNAEYAASATAIRHLRKLEAELREEIAAIDSHEDAWKNAAEDPKAEPYDISLRIHELVGVDQINKWKTALPDDNAVKAALSQSGRELFEKSGVLVSVQIPTIPGKGVKDKASLRDQVFAETYGIVFRHPYPAEISIWKIADEGGPRRLSEVTRTKVMVVDDQSPIGIVPFSSPIFSKRAVSVGFHDSGSLAEVSNQATSPAAAAFEALTASPGAVSTALETAGKIRTGLEALSTADVNTTIAKLTNEKKRIDAEIALRTTAATAGEEAERIRIQSTIDLLKARSELGDELSKIVAENIRS